MLYVKKGGELNETVFKIKFPFGFKIGDLKLFPQLILLIDLT